MNQDSFKINLGFLSKYLRYELNQEQVCIYWDLLKHLSDDKFEVACKNIIKEFIPTSTVPFPLVAHILKYCGDAGDNQVINAISTLKKAISRVGPYESINFNDPALHYTINAFGGWTAICSWASEDWNINEKRLMETYRTSLQTGREDCGYLLGISEKQNGYYRIYSILDNGKKITSQRFSPFEITARDMHLKQIQNNSENK